MSTHHHSRKESTRGQPTSHSGHSRTDASNVRTTLRALDASWLNNDAYDVVCSADSVLFRDTLKEESKRRRDKNPQRHTHSGCPDTGTAPQRGERRAIRHPGTGCQETVASRTRHG